MLLVIVIATALVPSVLLAQETSPEKTYAIHCASCHGDQGRGQTKQFAEPLTGDLDVAELARYIDETMPAESPDQVTGEAALQVAEYIHQKFYSAAARVRNNQPRIPLARLTVEQYRNKVADLIGSFDAPTWLPEKRGIKASYYAARRQTKTRRLAQQVDDRIDFAAGVPHFDPTSKYESIPKPKKKPENQMNEGFSAYWKGGLIAPVTGEYSIKVKSKNGFKLFVNDPATPLIDRAVRSDEVVDHSGKIYLLAGRMYHLRLDFFSYPDPPPAIQLLWQPPNQVESVVPNSALTQSSTNEVLAIATEFPADDASAGFERGVDVSEQWDRATTRAAIEAAEWISMRIERLAKFKIRDDNASAKAQEFCEQFVARGFCTPLSDADKQLYVGQQFDQLLSISDQVKRVVLVTLKSPRFLYPNIEPRPLEYQYAADMAMILWDSNPDQTITTKLRDGEFESKEKRTSALYAMTKSPKSRQKLSSFFSAWLSAHTEDAVKDKELFPEFDATVIADLKTSLSLHLNDAAWSDQSDFREMLTADYLYVNQRLANFYDLKLDQPNGFHKVKVDAKIRAGILTHPYLMTGLAYHKNSSPIHRGVFVAKRLLGRQLRQPPDDVKPLTEEFAPEMTTRERVEHQTKAPSCMNCHSVINPLGFSLENFDAVGRYRETDDDKPVNAQTVYRTRGGEDRVLNGARDLANFLANDHAAQKNFIRQLFRFYTKNEIDAFGAEQLDRLHRRFIEHEFRIRDLLVDIAMVVLEKTKTDFEARTTPTSELTNPTNTHETVKKHKVNQ